MLFSQTFSTSILGSTAQYLDGARKRWVSLAASTSVLGRQVLIHMLSLFPVDKIKAWKISLGTELCRTE